jgi:hypothetical protein
LGGGEYEDSEKFQSIFLNKYLPELTNLEEFDHTSRFKCEGDEPYDFLINAPSSLRNLKLDYIYGLPSSFTKNRNKLEFYNYGTCSEEGVILALIGSAESTPTHPTITELVIKNVGFQFLDENEEELLFDLFNETLIIFPNLKVIDLQLDDDMDHVDDKELEEIKKFYMDHNIKVR